MQDTLQEPKLRVLSVGLPRTGSASIAKALTILGYENVYHGIQSFDSPHQLKILERAADATFPALPTYTGQPFKLEDWEELFGTCEAATDVASLYASDLITLYPKVKVVLVIRDFNRWYKSVDETLFQQLWSTTAEFCVNYVEPAFGYNFVTMGRKSLLGFFNALTVEEARVNARRAFDEHYRQVRAIVPPDRLLVYDMKEGWKPLCRFLGKPVPEIPFPKVNEAQEFKRMISGKICSHIRFAALSFIMWLAGAAALVIALRMAWPKDVQISVHV
ncbi:hypothetical protein QQS21_007397 [Conoideocrella luteorostrata]|uniref:P-loop containing nucleoside triphosphate hydrolase protein n=1 Tax=Conoideocrella luteorostrata TaxID=1105319 RepID=A0AAJ0FXF1_9HYPO|nr:hypothetical protein QQS21_007397 [Conoideocrella luteorostrata]